MSKRVKFESVQLVENEVIDYTNPELADMSNPEGHVYKKVLNIQVTLETGERFLLKDDKYGMVNFPTDAPFLIDAANKVIEKIEEVGTVNLDKWTDDYPVYGSPAYLNEMAGKTAEQLGNM